MSWKKYIVSELCSDIIDCVNKTAPISVIPTPFYMLRTSDVRNGFINLENLNCVTEDTFKKWSRRGYLQEGDIVFTREAPLGEVGLVRKAENYFLGQRLVLYRANPDVCDNRFLLYWFLNPQKKESIKQRGVGSTVTHLRVPECEAIEVMAPDLPTQKRIGDILSAYDDLIENNQKQIKLLEEAAQRLYKEWFVDLRFPGWENAEIVDGVPVGWKKIVIGDLLKKIGRTKQVMTAEYMEKGSIPIIDQSKDFIAGYTNDIETIVDIGQPVIVFGDHTRILKFIQFPFAKGADGTQLIVSNDDCMPQSLFYCSLINVDLSNYHYARHFKYLKAEEILVPNQIIASKFDSFVQPIFEQIQRLRDKCIASSEARDRLLPKLMSGELEVVSEQLSAC